MKAINRKILKLAFPPFLESFSGTLIYLLQNRILGRFDLQGLAAIAVCDTVFWLVNSIFFSFVSTYSGVVSQKVGQKDNDAIARFLHLGLVLSLVLGLIFVVAYKYLLFGLVAFLGSEKLSFLANIYYQVIIFSFPLFFISWIFKEWFYAQNDVKHPLIATVIYGIVAVGLILGLNNYLTSKILLIAYSIFIAIALSVLYMGFAVADKESKMFKLKDLLEVVKPTGWLVLQNIGFGFGYYFFVKIIGTLGDKFLSIHEIAVGVETIAITLGTAFSIPALVLTGNYFGAGKKKVLIGVLNRNLLFAFFLILPVSVLLLFVPKLVASFFTNNKEYINLLKVPLMLAGIEQLFLAFSYIAEGALKGVSFTYPVFLASFSVWIARVPLGYFFAKKMQLGLTGIWLATLFDWSIRFTILYYYFYKLNKNKKEPR